MSTYRERREARAERYRDWAARREQRAAQVFESHRPYNEDLAYLTQPGHIPIRARNIAQEDRAFESLRKAESMNRRADEIDRQAEHAIYSDDPDAITRLEERIAELDAKRERIKAYNASCRRGEPDKSLLSMAERRDLGGPFAGRKGEMPAYVLTNLSGNIKRQRDRLAMLQRRAGQSRTRRPDPSIAELRAIVAGHGDAGHYPPRVDPQTANAILTVYDHLNQANQAKLAAMPLQRQATVAWKLLGRSRRRTWRGRRSWRR